MPEPEQTAPPPAPPPVHWDQADVAALPALRIGMTALVIEARARSPEIFRKERPA